MAETGGHWIEKSGTSLDMLLCKQINLVLPQISLRIDDFCCSFHNLICILHGIYFYVYSGIFNRDRLTVIILNG